MIRIEANQSLDFSFVFTILLMVAWTATIVWLDTDAQPLGIRIAAVSTTA